MNRFFSINNRKERLERAQELADLGSKAIQTGNFSEAWLFYQEAFLIRIEELGPEAPLVNQTADQLGEGILQSRQFSEARAFFLQSLEQIAEPQDATYAALGRLIERIGTYMNGQEETQLYEANFSPLVEARSWYETALPVYRKAFGAEDRQVLFLLQRMVGLNYNLGDLPEAKKVLEQVLTLDRNIFGQDHIKLASDLSSMGNIERGLGNLPEAKRCYEQAVAIHEQTLNPDNPRLAIELNNLAEINRSIGDLLGAKACYQRVLTIDQHTFGIQHPKVSMDLCNL
jgi:tetratricopeptide (TPR) repeat protein